MFRELSGKNRHGLIFREDFVRHGASVNQRDWSRAGTEIIDQHTLDRKAAGTNYQMPGEPGGIVRVFSQGGNAREIGFAGGRNRDEEFIDIEMNFFNPKGPRAPSGCADFHFQVSATQTTPFREVGRILPDITSALQHQRDIRNEPDFLDFKGQSDGVGRDRLHQESGGRVPEEKEDHERKDRQQKKTDQREKEAKHKSVPQDRARLVLPDQRGWIW
jgi:hypothetical protein